jgi:hypothetical protein
LSIDGSFFVRTQFPPAIENLLASLNRNLPALVTESVYNVSTERVRALRSDRAENLRRVLLFLVEHYDISTGSLIRRISARDYAQITVKFVAEKLGLCVLTVNRIFAYLEEIGLLETGRQIRCKVPGKGGEWLCFTSSPRRLSDKLWGVCGLLGVLIADRTKRLVSGGVQAVRRSVVKLWQPRKRAVGAVSIGSILEKSLFARE